MRSILFLSVCLIVYVCVIVSLILKAKDIVNNTKKYDVIPGYEKYRNSFWYERKYNRYGKHYYAYLIIGIVSLVSCVSIYLLLGALIQKYFLLPTNTFFLQSFQLYIGAIACIFFQIVFELWISFHSKASICIANSLYAFNSDKRSDSWAKLTLFVLIVSILCLPIMAISINAYSYADDEKIVTHNFLSIEEVKIPYDTIVSAETTYSSNTKHTEFDFSYHILLQDGTRINIMEFGNRGALYLHSMIQQHGISIVYGEIDAITYQLIKQTCKESTIQLVDKCYIIVP